MINYGFIVWMKNSVDPDQLASLFSADLDLHCFKKNLKKVMYFKSN